MWQMALYVGFLAVTMTAGGLMPWILEKSGSKWGVPPTARWRQQLNEQYVYISNNTYSFCPATPVVDYCECLGETFHMASIAEKRARAVVKTTHHTVQLSCALFAVSSCSHTGHSHQHPACPHQPAPTPLQRLMLPHSRGPLAVPD